MESDLYQHKIAVHNQTKNDDAQNIENSIKFINEKKQSLKCLFSLGGNDFCGAEFTLKSDLYKHKMSAHNNDQKPFKCEICRSKFSQKNNLIQHIQLMHPEKSLCQICNTIFFTEKDLKTHISSVHEEKKPFKCGMCKSKFSEKNSLNRHMVLMHKAEKSIVKCKVCHAVFTELTDLKRHLASAHEGKFVKAESPESTNKLKLGYSIKDLKKWFECTSCSKKFESNVKLEKHMKVHEQKKSNECPFCPFKTGLKKSLIDHVSMVHEGKKLYECSSCYYLFGYELQLKEHVLNVHEGKTSTLSKSKTLNEIQKTQKVQKEKNSENMTSTLGNPVKPRKRLKYSKKQFDCDLCSKKFESIFELGKHAKVVHEGDKPYECSFCSFKTGYKQGLINHVSMVHEGKRLYACSVCNYMSYYELQLKEHVLAVHEGKISQLVSEPKSKILKEIQKTQKVQEDKNSDDKSSRLEYPLPYGWKKVGQKRANEKGWDFYVFNPEGRKFRSNIQIKKYLEKNPDVPCDLEVTNTCKPKGFRTPSKEKPKTVTEIKPTPPKKAFSQFGLEPMPIIYENSNASTMGDCQSNKKGFDKTPDLVENFAPNVENNAPNFAPCLAPSFAPSFAPNFVPKFAPNVEIDAPNFATVPNGAPNFGSSSNVEIDALEVTEKEEKLSYNYGNDQFIGNVTVEPMEIFEAGIGNSVELQTKVLEGVKSPDEMPGKINKDSKKRFDCTLCSKNYESKQGLERHVKKNHEEKKYECSICPYKTGYKPQLINHVSTVHEKPYECSICPYKTGSKQNLINHVSKVHEYNKPYECSMCPYKSGYEPNLINHVSTVHEGNKSYECTMCDFESGFQKKLKEHILVVHDGKKLYKCSVCSFEAEYNHQLKIHFSKVHQGKNLHQCSKCNESFKVKDQLLKHTAFVHESGKFKCNSCDAQFSFKNLLKEHNVEVHGKNGTSRCSICHLAFATKPLMKKHKKSAHSDLGSL